MESQIQHFQQHHQHSDLSMMDSPSASSASSPAPVDNEESDFFNGMNDSQSSLGIPPTSAEIEGGHDRKLEKLAPIEKLPSEILMAVFSKLSSTSDLYSCLLVSKVFAINVVEMLWHRPSCSSFDSLLSICRVLDTKSPSFQYSRFIRRLNLATLGEVINDGTILPLAACSRLERLTLSNCKHITDTGLIPIIQNNSSLLALDVTGNVEVTGLTIDAIAANCKAFQGLNIASCVQISNESLVNLARNCKYIKRIKFNECRHLQNDAVMAFAENCPNILEVDLQQCVNVGVGPISALLARGRCLRELKLAECELLEDAAFLSLPPDRTYDHLRILDLTNCSLLTDAAVQKIVTVAPRLRNLFLAKCRNLTDAALGFIAKLGKNLHYLHLGHCARITDEGVKKLVHDCTRIRYIDLGCCGNLTDASITQLAGLQKLKRIGLVKCQNITNDSVLALAGRKSSHLPWQGSSLERVHLSYCISLKLRGIYQLLICCPRLTHLSLTGVQAFLKEDFQPYCRQAPSDFTPHQRSVFCVFSGIGVTRLRDYLCTAPKYSYLRQPPHVPLRHTSPVSHSPSPPRGMLHPTLLHSGVPIGPSRAPYQPPPFLSTGEQDDAQVTGTTFVFPAEEDWADASETEMAPEGAPYENDGAAAAVTDEAEMDFEEQVVPAGNDPFHVQASLTDTRAPDSSDLTLTRRPGYHADSSSSASAAGPSTRQARQSQPASMASMFQVSGHLQFPNPHQHASVAGMANRNTNLSSSIGGSLRLEEDEDDDGDYDAMHGVQASDGISLVGLSLAQPHL